MKKFRPKRIKNLTNKKLSVLVPMLGLWLGGCAPIFYYRTKPTTTDILTTKKNNSALAFFNNQEYQINDAIKDYLLTPTGLTTMVRDFVNLMITNFYESIPYIVDRNNPATLNNLANSLSGSLSTVKSTVQTKIDEINASANLIGDDSKRADWVQSNYDKFGGNEERFRLFNATQPLRASFITSLMNHNYLNFEGNESVSQDALKSQSDWSKIKFSNDKLSDPIAKIFADFQQFLFDDWYKYTNPVVVAQINWKYADANTKVNNQPILEQIYDKNKLSIQGIKLPDAANYKFPAFSSETETKFKNFFTNYNSLVDSSNGVLNDLNPYSDDVSTVWKVYSLNNLGKDDDLTSQAAAAILQIYNSNLLKNGDKVNVVNSIEQNNVDKDKILNNFLKTKTTDSNPSPKAGSTTEDKTIKIKSDQLFNSNSSTSSTDTKKIQTNSEAVYDFRQLKDQKWILYKDNKGANIITIDGMEKIKSSDDFNKNMLLWRGMLSKNTITLNDKVNYDLFSDLKKYLEEYFDQIILRYLIDKFKQKDTEQVSQILNNYNQTDLKTAGASQTNTNIFNGALISKKSLLFNGTYNPFWESDVRNKDDDLVNLLTEASKFLSASFFQGNLFNLRKKLTKDYAELLDQEPFADTDKKYYSNLNNGLSSRLPYDIAYNSSNDPTNYTNYSNTNDGGFINLEKVFFQTDTTGTYNKSIYNDSFKPGQLKKTFESYKQKVNALFSTSFDNDLKFDNDILKQHSRSVHFADGTVTSKDNLLIKPIKNLLLEAIKISGFTNKNLAELIQQKSLNETVKKYFDFNNSEWKVNDDNQINNNNSSTFKDDFKNNFALKFFAPDFFNEKVKQIYGGYKSEQTQKSSNSNDKQNFIKLLDKIKEQKYFVDSANGLDLLSDQTIKDFKLFLTVDWLMNNSWLNFRNYLLNFVGKDSQAGFVWLNQNKQDFTSTSTNKGNSFGQNKYSPSSEDYKFNSNPRNELTSPFLTNSSFNKISNFNTDINNWSFADIKSSGTNNVAVGFKGLVKKEEAAKATNDTVGPLLFDKFSSNSTTNDGTGLLSKWGSKANLIKYINHIKTFKQLDDLVTELESRLPNVDFANVKRITIKSPVFGSKPQTLTLTQRKNALINIVNGYQIDYRTGSESIFIASVKEIYNTNCSTSGSSCSHANQNNESNTNSLEKFPDTLFTRFTDSIENGISQSTDRYAIRATDSFTSYVVYMQQVNYADLISLDSFKKLLNIVSNDAILQVLFGAAQEDSQQKQALFSFLNSGQKKVIVYDQQLAQSLDLEWFTIKHGGGK